MNVPMEHHVRDAIDFEVNRKLEFKLTMGHKSAHEIWTCDMDSMGILFIESNLYHDKLYYIKNDRSISFYQYAGCKKSGLYAFSVGLEKIPYYMSDRLSWNTTIPYCDVLSGFSSIIWESIQPYVMSKSLHGSHHFKLTDKKFVLSSEILKNKKCYAERVMIFDKGLSELTYKSKNRTLSLRRTS